ncbi:MAG TPA: oligopeptide/dipeptide ABC transporter ATP-binding protein, partial [Steroidobacteraceae bacterium]|nr:oligopeptide/dipeptide ABC transporter ATP-binding protein [Steroidobacteraceae bacterium]
DLLRRLTAHTRTALVLITHDLGVVAGLADRVAVMYAGRIVEHGPVEAVLGRPAHPYTQGLLASIPDVASGTGDLPRGIPGQPPDPSRVPGGCAFYDRCDVRDSRCREERPRLAACEVGTEAACHFPRGVQ